MRSQPSALKRCTSASFLVPRLLLNQGCFFFSWLGFFLFWWWVWAFLGYIYTSQLLLAFLTNTACQLVHVLLLCRYTCMCRYWRDACSLLLTEARWRCTDQCGYFGAKGWFRLGGSSVILKSFYNRKNTTQTFLPFMAFEVAILHIIVEGSADHYQFMVSCRGIASLIKL